MTDPDEDFGPPPPPPRRLFRRLRRFTLWVFGTFAVIVLVLLVGRWQTGRLGERQLTVTTTKLDADEPGWRLDALLDERKKTEPPPNQNSGPLVLDIAAGIPNAWRTWQRSEDAKEWAKWGVNHRLPPKDAIDAARQQAAGTLILRTEAIRLREKRSGFYPLTIPADPLTASFPHLDKCRSVASFLQYDAYLAAVEKNSNRGISAARADLAVARSLGDEPFIVSQLVRVAVGLNASQTAMQVLAWSEPTEGLAELQAELLAEAEFGHFRVGMRGERGVIDKVFRGLEDGTIPAGHWFIYNNIRNPGPEHYAAFRAYRALIPGDHAKALEILTAYVEASKLPPHEQLAAIGAVKIPNAGGPDEFRYWGTRLLTPAGQKIAESGLRCRADLSASATCVACERFRLKHGRWPRDPAELVPAFLPAVPLNPFDGKPISYRVYPDRIAVYFFWQNSPYQAEFPAEFRDANAPGVGIGYRVWNPDQRGLPAEEKNAP